MAMPMAKATVKAVGAEHGRLRFRFRFCFRFRSPTPASSLWEAGGRALKSLGARRDRHAAFAPTRPAKGALCSRARAPRRSLAQSQELHEGAAPRMGIIWKRFCPKNFQETRRARRRPRPVAAKPSTTAAAAATAPTKACARLCTGCAPCLCAPSAWTNLPAGAASQPSSPTCPANSWRLTGGVHWQVGDNFSQAAVAGQISCSR